MMESLGIWRKFAPNVLSQPMTFLEGLFCSPQGKILVTSGQPIKMLMDKTLIYNSNSGNIQLAQVGDGIDGGTVCDSS